MFDRLLLAARLIPALPRLARYRPKSSASVADWLEERARSHPERPFIVFEDRRVDYGELNAQANRFAHWGRAQGIGRGDVVALLMENRPEYVAAWGGLAKLGATTALINTNQTGRTLRHSLETAHARHVVLGNECAPSWETLGDAPPELSVWSLSDPGRPDAAAPAGARDLDAALDAAAATNPEPSVREGLVSGDDLFYIYTSGTTGLPKAARFSHLRFLGAGEINSWALRLEPHDVYYCALPLYHSAGGVLVVGATLAKGATMALRRRFSASAFWDDVRKFDATLFQYIGEFCRYLMNQPPSPNDRDHRVRRICGNGLRPDIWQAFQERFGIERVYEFYGATEGNAALMNLENEVGSVGRMPFKALTNARLIRYDVERDEHVRDERGFCIECGPEEIGEFVAKIPSNPENPQGRFEGYTSQEATRKKILQDVFEKGDAWFRSGDLLRHDRRGFYYFVDRIGDTFRWKGENVSTQEVAEAVAAHPEVEMANVYGVEVPGADGRAGMAAIVLREGAELDGAGFHDFVVERLPRYAAPLFLRRIPEAEITGTFKLRKVTLQEEGFDPARVADPLWFRDDEAGAYVPLDAALAEAIRRGEKRV